MKVQELKEYLYDAEKLPKGRELTVDDIVGITLTVEQARLVSFCITNSWPELTEDEKITAQKLLTRVNKIYEEENDEPI